ncbi:MAG: hypothetical protein PGN09_14455 [Sphingomonas fennica]
MTRIKTIFAVVAAAASMQAVAAMAEPFTFSQNGETFVGERTEQGDATVIKGRNASSNEPFLLRVAGGWVNGNVAGRTVHFRVEEARGALVQTAN